MAERLKVRRCAIYTRKSSEEGLNQAYNSLDAQHDACAAYIASQKHEGWVLVEKHYDDGGFSGGSLDRPALKILFDDLAGGLVDIIVVYKIDRLTRSLSDFAKLTELFDKHNTSFVAVTQQFNTSTSMGRLTLNVLLSFAQFEREVSGERIRDKIGASKRRGMWMGGRIPLGYDVKDKKLVVNEQEAKAVQHIFMRYGEVKSVRLLQAELELSNVRSKRHVDKNGASYGGGIIYRGALSHILTNQIYRGVIAFKGEFHKGEHDSIVDEDLFQSVQVILAAQGPGVAAKQKIASPAILKGFLFDDSNYRLQPTHSVKHGRKYRYYVSACKIRDAKANPGGYRIPASDLERVVIERISDKLRDSQWLVAIFNIQDNISGFPKLCAAADALAHEVTHQAVRFTKVLGRFIERIEVAKRTIKISINATALQSLLAPDNKVTSEYATEDQIVDLVATGQFLRCGKQVRLVIGDCNKNDAVIDSRLVREIVQARSWFEDLLKSRIISIAELARRSGYNASHVSRRISLAFLAPDITQLIVDGLQPSSLTLERLKQACPLPISWDEQRTLLLGR